MNQQKLFEVIEFRKKIILKLRDFCCRKGNIKTVCFMLFFKNLWTILLVIHGVAINNIHFNGCRFITYGFDITVSVTPAQVSNFKNTFL